MVVMSGPKGRSVTLPQEKINEYRAAAEAAGTSLSAWLVKAADKQCRAENAEATARYLAQPEIAEQVAAYTSWAEQSKRPFLAALRADAA